MDLLDLADYEAAAERVLPPFAWDFYSGGAGDERTVADNRDAFRRIKLRPRILNDVSSRDLGTSLFGQPVALPVLLAPTTCQRLAHPDAELATARAAGASGAIAVCSTFTYHPIEEIAAASAGPVWFQLYPLKSRAVSERLVERAEAAGCAGIVLTADLSYPARWNRRLRVPFAWPEDAAPGNLVRVDDGKAFKRDDGDFDHLALTWSDLEWLRACTRLPLLLKGILTAEDARRAVDGGADGIIVSNHGGRTLDDAVASIDALPEVVAAVDGRATVLLDGGVRQGIDVVKALALGAAAVLVGRPYLWGLAIDGETGVRRVLEILRAEIDSALALLGRAEVRSLDRSLVTGWARPADGEEHGR